MRALAFIVVLLLAASAAQAQSYHREELRLPMAAAGPRGLEALLVRPDAPGKYPLVLMSHGAPRKPEQRPRMSPWSAYPQAMEFARRGFVVVSVMRRGYGGSDGAFAERAGGCEQPDYVRAGQIAAEDLRAAITALGKRPDVDGSRVIAVGQSAGGFAAVALTADPPLGLVGAISFAGGRGSQADFELCNEARLVDAFRTFGRKSRLPMLWVYTANDHYFAPAVASRFHTAFTEAGGRAQFIAAPAFGADGHSLFSANGIAQWTPYVDSWLAEQKLTQRAQPMALPSLPDVAVPAQLNRIGREAFERYLRAGPHKAFAMSSDGGFGWRTASRSADEAKSEALKSCAGDKGRVCKVVFVGEQPAP